MGAADAGAGGTVVVRDEGCATVVADAWAAGSMARSGAVAGEETTADGADDDEDDGGEENSDPTDSVPI